MATRLQRTAEVTARIIRAHENFRGNIVHAPDSSVYPFVLKGMFGKAKVYQSEY